MFTRTFNINWTDRTEQFVAVDVTFKFIPGGWQDAEDEIKITAWRLQGPCNLPDAEIEEFLYEAIEADIAESPEQYVDQ